MATTAEQLAYERDIIRKIWVIWRARMKSVAISRMCHRVWLGMSGVFGVITLLVAGKTYTAWTQADVLGVVVSGIVMLFFAGLTLSSLLGYRDDENFWC